MAPPPSVNSHTPSDTKTPETPRTPDYQAAPPHTATKEVNGKTANTVVLDLLRHMMESADILINGQTVEERDTMNGIMRKHLRDYNEDLKNAEIEIFGRELELNELENIEEPKRTEISKRLSQAIKRRTEARYIASTKTSGQALLENITYTI